jgi:hypothetical protein
VIVISEEGDRRIGRLRDVLAHGTKEDLVESPED